jgi:predicted nucleic acid-binding protein
MRVVLDACVLYPTVLREILMGVAAAGLYEPVWSERILREWVLATAKIGPGAMVIAEGEATVLRANFPRAMQKPQAEIEAKLALPDANDLHVLAVAISSHADAIVTFNAVDFPRPILAEFGLDRRDPDGFLWEIFSRHPEKVAEIVEQVRARAELLSTQPMPIRKLMKRVQLPRFGKALAG